MNRKPRTEAQKLVKRAWELANPDRVRAYAKRYKARHVEAVKRVNKLHRTANPEMYKATKRRSYLKHKEKTLASCKRYRDAHPEAYQLRKVVKREHLKKLRRAYYERNKKKILSQTAAWHKANPEKVRGYHRKWFAKKPWKRSVYNMRRRLALQSSVIGFEDVQAFYKFIKTRVSVRCYYCGVMVPGKNTHIDHIVPLSRGGAHAVDNLCAACPKCNLTKQARTPSEWIKTGQQLLTI